MTCASCGTENEAGRKFCGQCGQRLASPCPSCGSSNTPGTKFCGECGTPLADAGTAAAGHDPTEAPATERRMVSVLFADLVGFTTLSERRDPEDVRELLARYFEASREVIDRYGGTVEKFIGDAVMAVWGTPVAQEDDAERAVRAALDLVDAVHRLGADHAAAELALRAGVHTGEAVVTIGATGMGMVAGDLVNTAARLQSVAPPGTVLVGDGTRRASDTAIVFEPAGEQQLKGKASPVPAFRALRVVAQRGGVGRTEGLEPPFVGREPELRLIKDFYHATARDRGPRVVSVIGQAGIGKSRLAWEFLKYIDGVTEIVHWHQGRSPAYGDGISFWALGEMVRMRIGTEEGADEASTRVALGATLDAFVPDPDERSGLEEPLLHLLGVGASPALERGQLFVAWRTFFERIAEVGPVVMVFEDLQWADDGLLDFIDDFVTWSRGRPVYIITLARAELLDRRPTWGAGQRSFTSLNLAPLADDEMRSLLAGLVPGLADAVIDRIVERAEGIPLYAVETVRTLLNDGRIERHGDAFRPTGDLSELSVPASLHALIAARIDALPGDERTLIQDGSVLGHAFSLAALRAVTRVRPDELQPMLQHLVQRELLTVEDDPRSPDRGQYRFVQGLLREVAYGTLARDDRRARHLAAARYFESLGDDELSGVLAQHYVDAYQAHPEGPEGAAVAAQARVALRGAAQRASELGSHRLAHSYLSSALLVVTDSDEELELQVAAMQAATRGGVIEVGVAHGRRAIELARELGRDADRRLATAAVADTLLEGHQQASLDLLNEAMDEPGLAPGSPGYIELATILAKAEMRRLNDTRAVELADLALPEAARAGNDRLVLELLITRAVCLSNLGRVTESITILTGALDLARRRGLVDSATRAAVNLGYAIAPSDPVAAYEVSRQALDDAIRSGVIWGIRYLLGNAVDSAIEIGRWDWAMEEAGAMDPLFTELAERIWFGSFTTVVRSMRGEDVTEAARALYDESRDVDDHQFRAVGSIGLLVDSLVRGDHAEAIRVAREAVKDGLAGLDHANHGARAAIWAGDPETAREMITTLRQGPTGGRERAMIAALEGGVAMLDGHTTEARALYEEAQRTARQLGTRWLLGMIDLDIVVTGAMEPAERQRAADEARAIFTDLRATRLLELLDEALATARGAEAKPQMRSTTEEQAIRRT